MQTAVPASYCANINVDSRALRMCVPVGKASRVEDAVIWRRVCFWRRSFNSFGESPGSLEPGGRIWIEELAEEEGVLVKDMELVETLVVGVIGELFAADLDLKPCLLPDILSEDHHSTVVLGRLMSSRSRNEQIKL
jgi:hypothetical protein